MPIDKADRAEMIGNKFWRQQAKVIARFVRDSLEDLHAKNVVMTDDNMPDINRAIRRWVYAYIRFIQLPKARRDKLAKWVQPPDYREDDVFDDIDKEYDALASKNE
jgi:hypothetical protein